MEVAVIKKLEYPIKIPILEKLNLVKGKKKTDPHFMKKLFMKIITPSM